MRVDDVTRMNTASFWARVDIRGPDECWEWQGKRSSLGYGRVYVTGSGKAGQREVGAHEVAALAEFGPPPRGKIVMHTCDNPPCCNARHLLYGTKKDNSQDALVKGRLRPGFPGHELSKTHCPNGHPYSGDNLKVDPRGHRRCRACRRVPFRKPERRAS